MKNPYKCSTTKYYSPSIPSPTPPFNFQNLIMNFHQLTLTLLVLSLFVSSIRADVVPQNALTDIACKIVNCGQGVCVPSNGTLLPFTCQCNPGWKNLQVGSMTFPACVVPNCTTDFSCGGTAPALPPSPSLPVPLLPPPVNLSDPCALTWCGDGTCVSNGATYICQCSQGSSNLMNMTNLACFKECFFGADCSGLGFGPAPPTTPDSSGSPRNGTQTATPSGKTDAAISTRTQYSLTVSLLIGILFSLF